MRINLAIDPKLLGRAVRVSGAKTKTAAVTLALRELIARREQRRLLDSTEPATRFPSSRSSTSTRGAGRPVRLEPKAFDLLDFLIECRPVAVPNPTIRDRPWKRSSSGAILEGARLDRNRAALNWRRPVFP
jgi:Arc/MetJ family transcription regulator